MFVQIPIPSDYSKAKSYLQPLMPILQAEAKAKGNGAKPALGLKGTGARGPVALVPHEDDEDVGLMFYETEVVTYHADGKVTLRDGADATGGRMSNSTARVLNAVLAPRGQKLQGTQGIWLVRPTDPSVGLFGALLFQGTLVLQPA